jgi:hypothetical protein
VWVGAVEHAIVEVKSRNEEFDSAEDFGRRLYRKYKEREIFVDTKYGWDSKDPKPRYVFMVSRPTGKVICLPGRTQEKWSVGERHDNTRNITDKFYMAHPDLFIPVKKAIGWMMKKQASLEPSRYEVGKLTLQLKHSNKILDRIQNAVLNEESNEKMIEDALCDRWPE